MKTILMSIKKEHFDALVSGIKKHEFRKKFSKMIEDYFIVFYASDPDQGIIGYGKFSPAIKGSIEKMVEIVKTHNYSSPENIRNYYSGKMEGYALPCQYAKYVPFISINEIRKNILNFVPPQSYLSMDNPKYEKLKEKIFKGEKIQHQTKL